MNISTSFLENIQKTTFSEKDISAEKFISRKSESDDKSVKNLLFQKYLKNDNNLKKDNKSDVDDQNLSFFKEKIIFGSLFNLLFKYISKFKNEDQKNTHHEKFDFKKIQSFLKNLDKKFIPIKDQFFKKDINDLKNLSFEKLYSILKEKNLINDLKQVNDILNKIGMNKNLNFKIADSDFNHIVKNLNQLVSSLGKKMEMENDVAKDKVEIQVKDLNKFSLDKKIEIENDVAKDKAENNLNKDLSKSLLDKKIEIKNDVAKDKAENNLNKDLSKSLLDKKIEVKNDKTKDKVETKIKDLNKFSLDKIEINYQNNDAKMNLSNHFHDFLLSTKSFKDNINSNELKSFQNEKIIAKDIFNQLVQKMVLNNLSSSKSKMEADVYLKPDFLGKSSFKIISDSQNSLKGILFVENFELKKILEAQIPYLKNKLLEMGIHVENFDVFLHQDTKNFGKNDYKFDKKVDDYTAYSLNGLKKFNQNVSDHFLYGNYKVNLII